ncbi:sunset domain-containing protein [Terrabacter sp. 2RAF25]|uniref:sunset domain-containing protein n=1 Tax=Terrabacter sp. 2RAF25 TaxID=3232998 RepID=UPI003F9D37AC
MSDTVKLILWIAVAVIVIGIIVWLFVNAGRRREVEARRFEAGELRAKVEERRPEVLGSQDRASVTAAMAEDAKAEADRAAAEAKRRAEEARRLEQQAAQHRAAAESANAEHADLEREADRVDPDVRTDDEGYRLDDDGNRLAGQEDSSRRGGGAASAAAVGAAGAAGAGAAAFAGNHEDDEEDDLADAENPFAPTGSSRTPSDSTPEEGTSDDRPSASREEHGAAPAAATGEPAGAADAESVEETGSSRYEEPAWEPSDPGVGQSTPRDEALVGDGATRDAATRDAATRDGATRDEANRDDVSQVSTSDEAITPARADVEAGYAEDEPGDAGAHSDDTVDGDPLDEQTNDELTAQQTSEPGGASASDDRDSTADGPGAGTVVAGAGAAGAVAGAAASRGGERPDEQGDERSTTDGTRGDGDTLAAGTDEGDLDDGVASESKAAADKDHVDVPALADRDEVVAEGGTPATDPGDHRGQPWATTPGQRGPEESDEPADEGRDVDMAPHSHESDEVSDVDEPVGSTSEEPRRQEAEPAPDVAAAAYPEGDDAKVAGSASQPTSESTPSAEGAGPSASADAAGTRTDAGDTRTDAGDTRTDAGVTETDSKASTGRRISEFDEVVDGGFGLGSAAPIGDGAQPLGHAVKGTREGTTFLGPDDEGYDDAEPDVWFYSEEAARRAGFTKRGE